LSRLMRRAIAVGPPWSLTRLARETDLVRAEIIFIVHGGIAKIRSRFVTLN
jgi:hypothetical protein